MVAPRQELLGTLEVFFQRLLAVVAVPQYWIEAQFREPEHLDLGSLLAGGVGIGVGQSGAQAVGLRMGGDHEDAGHAGSSLGGAVG